MVRTACWKYIYWPRHQAQLFDLANDPGELNDLGGDAGHAAVRTDMRDRLLFWMALRRNRVTLTDGRIKDSTGKAKERGYLFGVW